MENYKQLNSELVSQVQVLKTNLAAYQNELIYLRSLVFEEHSQRVQQEQDILNLLAQTFANVVKNINPDVDIMKLFCNARDSADGEECDTTNSAISPNCVRDCRSSEIIQEFRRSVVVQKSRKKSTETMSPIKKYSMRVDIRKELTSNGIHLNNVMMEVDEQLEVDNFLGEEDSTDGEKSKEDVEEESGSERSLGEEDKDNANMAELRTNEIDASIEKSMLSMSLDCIPETEEENHNEECIQNNDNDISNDSHHIQNSTIVHRRSLADITNQSGFSNYLLESMSTATSPQVEIRRGNFRDRIKKDGKNANSNDPSTSKLSNSTMPETARSKDHLLPSKENTIFSEIDNTDFSGLNVSELILRDGFKEVLSSTPCENKSKRITRNMSRPSLENSYILQTEDTNQKASREGKTINSSESVIKRMTSYSLNEGNSTLRPSRRCKPTSLAEPNLISKIRNETENKKKTKVRKKSGNRK